ncbi:unnamed protein product [Pieris macdunnoughi]|uniref:Uncharacterized protein n=1 Tax=Pieris macdunnoughi TaxID=345717 RepID=A0A821SVR2_9NEOP|nr:unnamed protein product [Pieris macdunnoughi]
MMSAVLREIVIKGALEKKEEREYREVCPKHEHFELLDWELNLPLERRIRYEEMASSGLNGLYRPRSALARAMYEKHRNDRYLQEFDQNEVSLLNLVAFHER